MKIIKSQRAVSSVELTTIVIILLSAMIVFGGYIQRALAGRWKSTGDAYGQGRQYDPRGFGGVGENGGTMDCFYDQRTNLWIDEDSYRDNGCDCTFLKADGSPLPEHKEKCTECKTTSLCASPPS